MWITNSPISPRSRLGKVEDEDNRIRGFVVERGTPGFETPFIEGKFSLRASPTGEIHWDCRIPAANMLPESADLRAH